jgi:hypothetical protein
MIWIVLAIIVAAFIIASAIKKQGGATHYPIQDPNDPNYKLAYRIIDDYLDGFSGFTLQAQITQICAEKLKNSRGGKERRLNEKNAQESREALDSMVNGFWANYGGYNKMFDPNVVPRAVWPEALINKYNAQVAKFEDMNQSVRQMNQA